MATTDTQLKHLLYTDRFYQNPTLIDNGKYSITLVEDKSGSTPKCFGAVATNRLTANAKSIYLPSNQIQWMDRSLDGLTNPMFTSLSLNPYLWLDANGITDLHSATTVARLYDQSGNQDSDRDAVYLLDYPTIADPDSSYNGNAAIAVTYQKLLKVASSISVAAPYTLFFIGEFGSAHGADTYQQMIFSNDTSDVIFGKKVADSKIYLGSLAGPTAPSGPALIVGVVDGSSSKIYVNSKTAGATGASTTATLTAVSFGGEEAGANALQGKIAQAMIVSGAVSATNVGYWMDRMSTQYNVTLT